MYKTCNCKLQQCLQVLESHVSKLAFLRLVGEQAKSKWGTRVMHYALPLEHEIMGYSRWWRRVNAIDFWPHWSVQHQVWTRNLSSTATSRFGHCTSCCVICSLFLHKTHRTWHACIFHTPTMQKPLSILPPLYRTQLPSYQLQTQLHRVKSWNPAACRYCAEILNHKTKNKKFQGSLFITQLP